MTGRPISAVIERWRERVALVLYGAATAIDPKPRVEIDRRDGEPGPRSEGRYDEACGDLCICWPHGERYYPSCHLTVRDQRSITGGYEHHA